MQDFGAKTDNSPPPGGQLSAAEFNNLATENENAVSRSGQTLSGASDTQLAQSLFLHGVKSESFQDSGAANAYVATPISGASGVLLPADYAAMDGAVITFKASNSNTAASTLNIGQTTGALLGAKAIRTQTDTAISSGDIVSGQYIQVVYNPAFNAGAGAWELLPWGVNGGKLLNIQSFSTAGAFVYTPTAGTKKIKVRAIGGGGAGGGAPATGAGVSSLGGAASSGSYAEALFTTGFSGVTITVGAGGTGNLGVAGSNGGATSFGGLLVVPGGLGAISSPSLTSATLGGAAAPSAPTGGNIISSRGTPGGYGLVLSAGNGIAGLGGPSVYGLANGNGGGGAFNSPSSAATVGQAGSAGLFVVEEYS